MESRHPVSASLPRSGRGSNRRRATVRVALGALAAFIAGCSTPAYYLQAVGGQLELWREAQPIEQLSADGETGAALKEKLDTALRIRDFASRELALPANGSYRKYADIKRPYVVWTVFSAEALSIHPKEWCFPVAGCVSYRGYFAKEDAQAFARELRRQGYDVYIGGVPAYSTLGWFDDPILNTFIHYPDTEIARLIFHELAHQLIYVRGDSEFNESFASAVETIGVERWLAAQGTPQQRAAFEQAQERREDFFGLVLKYRERLDALYASQLPDEEKRRRKEETLAQLKQEYGRIKNGKWNGYAGYDRWFGQEINNATLASVGIYTRLVPAFEELLAASGDDLPRFYAEVRKLASLPQEARESQLALLLAAATQASIPRSATGHVARDN
jgi:predicted aminopeptidase